MIYKFIFGKPICTDATIKKIDSCNLDSSASEILPLIIDSTNNLSLMYTMQKKDCVFGLGENVRGINKRGWKYTSKCSDDPCHSEDTESLYGAHNFIVIKGEENIGIFIDCSAPVIFDIGYTDYDKINISCNDDCTLYIIKNNSVLSIIHEFRELIGQSYIPPYWAFGYQQSRWSYNDADAVRDVVRQYRDNNIPIDAVYLDIDYMDNFKDFTINESSFPDFDNFVSEMKEQGIHLVPIIDAGVKEEKGYDFYEEGVSNNYFCKTKDGEDFKAAVWPGMTSFPDFFQKETRKWFGDRYSFLLDKGIEGFWNDMNEPAIFFSKEQLNKAINFAVSCRDKNIGVYDYFSLKDHFINLSNSEDDYKKIYHKIDGEMVCHTRVHNLYGTKMTLAAAESFERNVPDKRILIFSRASYIGMHRYSGIWTGDNYSWWSHLLLNIQMMPSINMCGFLYSGADLGGFGSNATMDLVLRWLAFGIFTPLMRNHAAIGTRNQEVYRFNNLDEFRNIINLRYMLIPHIYSEFVKASINNELFFKALAFEYPNDETAVRTEDQLLLGDSIMIAPVYTQNSIGRHVYLPEDMLYILYKKDGKMEYNCLEKGHHYINVNLDEVPLFIRENKLIVFSKTAQNTSDIDSNNLHVVGYIKNGCSTNYSLYEDDGVSKNINLNNLYNISVSKDMDGVISSDYSHSKKLNINIY